VMRAVLDFDLVIRSFSSQTPVLGFSSPQFLATCWPNTAAA
jgi:hypothetical protein